MTTPFPAVGVDLLAYGRRQAPRPGQNREWSQGSTTGDLHTFFEREQQFGSFPAIGRFVPASAMNFHGQEFWRTRCLAIRLARASASRTS